MVNPPPDNWLVIQQRWRAGAEPQTRQEAEERAVNAYRDERYAERLCDFCRQPYRGPAVYCGLFCAEMDA